MPAISTNKPIPDGFHQDGTGASAISGAVSQGCRYNRHRHPQLATGKLTVILAFSACPR